MLRPSALKVSERQRRARRNRGFGRALESDNKRRRRSPLVSLPGFDPTVFGRANRGANTA